MVATKTAQEIWEIALNEIQAHQVSKTNYRTWFSKTIGLSFQGNQFIIGVPHTFAAEYLEKNQRVLIEKVLTGLTVPDAKVSFQVNGRFHSPERDTSLSVPPPVLPNFTRLNPSYTFDTFIEGGGNKLARAAALAVVESPGCAYNPLSIYGGVGLGKTHLLHAIGHKAMKQRIGVIYVTAEQFTNEFTFSLRDRTTDEFRDKYRNAGMLLVDDVQFLAGKEQTEESFFHTFNSLHNGGRQIILASDRRPKFILHTSKKGYNPVLKGA